LFPGANITTINCTGSDDAAFAAWNTAAIASNPQLAVLHLTGTGCNNISQTKITNGITNSLIWAYGTPFLQQIYFGGSPTFGTVADPNGDYLASNASIGATSVTLTTHGAASNYTVGQYAAVVGLEAEAQDCGFPPGPRFYDYVLVTGANASTGVITFTPALTYNYLTTWPDVGATDCVTVPGPAAIVPMATPWNGTLSVLGLNMNNAGACSQVVTTMKVVYILDSIYPNPVVCPVGNVGLDPTVAQSYTIAYTDIGSTEIDKLIDTLTIDHSTGVHAFSAVSNLKNIIISNTTLSAQGGSTGAWSGTSGHTSITNSKFAQLWIGPGGPGSTTLSDNSILLDHVTVPTAVVYFSYEPISSMTYNSGTGIMTIPLASVGSWFHVAVPGQKVALGENGVIGTPVQAFTFTAVTADATNLYVQTDLVGSFPTASCGVTCTQIVLYPAPNGGIKQINNPAGTPDFTQYAAPN
jgi:hypothetical protein